MSNLHVVLLAAGQSSRLYPLTLDCPKSLLPFGDQPLLLRTIKQLQTLGQTTISVVVGHLQHKIKSALSECDPIHFIENDRYASDVNSLSLHLGLANSQGSVLVVEADVALSDACLPTIKTVCQQSASTWFTYGKFLRSQVGGIIKSDAQQNIVDMKIVPQFADQYADYSKNLGMVYIGPHEIDFYKRVLANAIAHSTQSYYMEHWIQHLPHLSAKEMNLFPHPAGSFNTMEELAYCQQLMASQLHT